MKIYKVINNNFVIVKDACEMVVMGVGIGFQKKPGETLDENKIKKTFYLSNEQINIELYHLLKEIPMEIAEIAENTISDFIRDTKRKLNNTIHMSLIDHLYNAVKNQKEGLTISNVFLFDIKRFYPEEFKYGKQVLNQLNETYKITLPEDEAGFIALHFVTAGLNEEQPDTYKITQLLKELSAIVFRCFKMEFDTDSVVYNRFITHLKYFSQRIICGTMHADKRESDESFTALAKMYPEAYECAVILSKFVQKEYHKTVEEEEQFYLMIHIIRILEKAAVKKEKV